jgi:hypothetical protein
MPGLMFPVSDVPGYNSSPGIQSNIYGIVIDYLNLVVFIDLNKNISACVKLG